MKGEDPMSILEEQNARHVALLEKLRAEGRAKRYDVDPFVEVFTIVDNVYHFYVKSPGAGGDPWMHLVVGPERALLIDTAYGIGNLKGLVETLTDKPYDVVNTHFHGDHAMGNYQFNRVYSHKYDVPSLIQQLDPKARERFVPNESSYYKASDLVPVRDYEIVGVDSHYIFDLGGGHEIELIHMPGHAPGGCVLLDKKNRMLFSGDAIVNTPTFIFGDLPAGEFSEYMTIRSYKAELLKLKERKGEFDGLYPGHSWLGVPPVIVDEMIEVCDSIINDPDKFDEDFSAFGRPARIRKIGYASIAFSKSRV
jgi:glyoxylase-like metal-dependent hydrolase (beta-lactamase superfamily II)